MNNENHAGPNFGKNKAIDTIECTHSKILIVKSTTLNDPAWDDFLNNITGAEFEQSSLWAAARKSEGWDFTRFVFFFDNKIAGGYQIFSKVKKYVGKIGYTIKGPVYSKEYSHLAPVIVEHLLKEVKKGEINFLIIQPPLIAPAIDVILDKKQIPKEKFLSIIKVSVEIDFNNKSATEIFAGLNRKRRQDLNKAENAGLRFTEGSYEDLDLFFQLMLITCERKKVSPNPSTLLYLKRIWEQFALKKQIKLFFVEYNDEKICGLISILFGKKVYMWKFGWSGKYASFHPGVFIFWKTIEWAIINKFDAADFMGTSKSYLPPHPKCCSKIPVTEIKGKGDIKLCFGGNLLIFPDARIVFNNLLLKIAYHMVIFTGKLSGNFKRMVNKL